MTDKESLIAFNVNIYLQYRHGSLTVISSTGSIYLLDGSWTGCRCSTHIIYTEVCNNAGRCPYLQPPNVAGLLGTVIHCTPSYIRTPSDRYPSVG